MKKTFGFTVVILLVSMTLGLSGCSDEFWDPGQIGRFRTVPAVNVILDNLGVAEETPSAWEEAEDPRPSDVIVYETDYVFGTGDVVRISIFELLQAGVPFLNDYVVTETGKVSIPEVGVVDAMGLTESQLEDEVKQILSPGILKDPSVTVTLLSSQQRTFSILGNGIPLPSRYNIPRYDFRLNDALAIAGGISQFNISYIYVSRPITGREAISGPSESIGDEPDQFEPLTLPKDEMLEIIAPRAQGRGKGKMSGLVIASAEMATDRDLTEAALPEGFGPSDGQEELAEPGDLTEIEQLLEEFAEPPAPGLPAEAAEVEREPAGVEEGGQIEWEFQNGRWVPIQIGRPREVQPPAGVEVGEIGGPLRERLPDEFAWGEIGTGGVQRRVIRIPADKLRGGDPRYNIVIRPGDTIQVPVDIIGEFCIMGNVAAVGYINVTGRPMTLKMAITAAGGLGPLAWPKRCEVIRRIGKDKEEIVMVDLEKITRGELPDFFIKPNDLINVGTHPTARWRAVLRNAFRATYGFGFVYDRNFADRDFGTSRPFGSIFDRIF